MPSSSQPDHDRDRSVTEPVATVRPSRSRSRLQQALPIYQALLLAILTVAGIYLLIALRHVLLILFISLLFAAAVSRPASQLERLRIPRGIAALLVYLAALGILFGIGWFVLPPLFGQIASLVNQVPDYAERYQDLRVTYEGLRQQYPELAPFEEEVSSIGSRVVVGLGERLSRLPSNLFSLFLDLLSVFVISLLLITTRGPLLDFVISMVHPDHRETTRRVVDKAWERIGHYLRAKLIVMVIIAALTYGALLLIGVPYPLLLAIVVGFGEVIPRIGPWLARIPLLVIAAFEGLTTFGLTFGASIIIENAKGYAISPFVEGSQLDIHPLLVFVAVLVGAGLLGFAGAFIAVPAAAIIQVIFEEVIIPWRRAQLAEAAGAYPDDPAE